VTPPTTRVITAIVTRCHGMKNTNAIPVAARPFGTTAASSSPSAVTAAASWVSSCAVISMTGDTGVVDSRFRAPFSRQVAM
jgi:putative alpha-1,2-mannosidase